MFLTWGRGCVRAKRRTGARHTCQVGNSEMRTQRSRESETGGETKGEILLFESSSSSYLCFSAPLRSHLFQNVPSPSVGWASPTFMDEQRSWMSSGGRCPPYQRPHSPRFFSAPSAPPRLHFVFAYPIRQNVPECAMSGAHIKTSKTNPFSRKRSQPSAALRVASGARAGSHQKSNWSMFSFVNANG